MPGPAPGRSADAETHGPALSNSETHVDHLPDLFRSHGLRRTRQRELIYGALANTTRHPTAEELHGMVHRLDTGISLATVYNALEAFSGAGLVRKLPAAAGNGASRFDATVHPHVHVTLDDGRVIDVPEDLSLSLLDALPEEQIAEIEQRLGVRVSEIKLDLTGHSAD